MKMFKSYLDEMTAPRFVPWRRVSDWRCLACGECCKHFEIPLRAEEYARIIGIYGLDVVRMSLGRAYLKKIRDSRCIFQSVSLDRWLCGLQKDKPLVCKLWPFAILENPKYGKNGESIYHYQEKKFYVYVHLYCRGLLLGKPLPHLRNKVIPEAVRLSLCLEESQKHTISNLVNPSFTAAHTTLPNILSPIV
jgi:Fe-S-cluster containining protein